MLLATFNLRVKLLLLVLTILPAIAWAQTPYFIHFGFEDGLPSSEVYQSLQDHNGYMWFATDRGVARFDGYNFKVFTTADGLCHNSVIGIYLDQRGWIWCYTFNGCLSYIKDGEVFNHPANDKLANNQEYLIAKFFAIDDNDTIWIGHDGYYNQRGFIKIDPENNISFSYHGSQPLDAYVVKAFANKELVISYCVIPPYDDSAKAVFISPEGKAFKIDSELEEGKPSRLSGFYLRSGEYQIQLGKNSYLWNGVDPPRRTEDNSVHTLTLHQDDQGNIWQSLANGSLIKNSNPVGLLPDKIVADIFQDKEGNMWLSTLNDGVYMSCFPNGLTFQSKNQFKNQRLYDFIELDKYIVISTYQGTLFFVDKQSYEVTTSIDFGVQPYLMRISDSTFLTKASKYAVDQNGYIFTYDKITHTLPLHSSPKIVDSDSLFLDIQFRGILRVHLSGKHTNDLGFSTDTLLTFPKGKIKAVNRAPDKSIWISMTNHLYRVQDSSYTNLINDHPLLNERIDGIDFLNDKVLFATLGNGLVIKDQDRYWNISREDGLLSNLCNGVKVDPEGRIWVLSNGGLSKITPGNNSLTDYSIENFTRADGLLSNEVDDVLFVDSLIWVRSDNGLSVLNRFKPSRSDLKPKILLQSLKVNHQEHNLEQALELDYSENNLEINFVGISYRSEKKLTYRYQLQGIDDTWYTTTNTLLSFPLLPPGSYTFKVFAENHAGIRSAEPAILHFTIASPIWQRWWFYLIVVLALLIPAFWVIRARDQRLKKESQLLMASLESEQKALRSQITPHFIFNSINGILGLITENEKMMAVRGLSQFAHLMRRILKQSEHQYISLDEEIESLRLYLNLEQLRFKENFSHTLTWTDNIDPEVVNIPPMLLQPYVENAIWHGLFNKSEGERKLLIHFSLQGENLICCIEDNGIGREKAAELRKAGPFKDKSRGMTISKERLNILSRNREVHLNVTITDLKNEQGEACGTRVELVVPLDF